MTSVTEVFKTTNNKISRQEESLIDLIEGWIWEGEEPVLAISVRVFTSINQGNIGVFAVTNDRFIVNYLTEHNMIWQQSIVRSESVEVPRKRARPYPQRGGDVYSIFEAGAGFPGSHAIGVPVQFEQLFKDAITS
ncbi:MAG: hypothetical protein NTW81_07150, partial [Actinobacteria bacterium]|nr:hypothetical protein [Actinomycetota bacterium]